MKTLFVSLAFFFYAAPYIQTSNSGETSSHEDAPLTLTELIKFRNESSPVIGKALIDRNWKKNIVNTESQEEMSWKLGYAGTKIVVYHSPKSFRDFDGPGIRMSTYSEEEYNDLVAQAKAGLNNLKKCTGSSHEDDGEIHFTGKDINVLFSEEEDEIDYGISLWVVRVYGQTIK